MKTNNIEICIIDNNVSSDTEKTVLSLQEQCNYPIEVIKNEDDNMLLKKHSTSNKWIIFINGGALLKERSIDTLIANTKNNIEWVYCSNTSYESVINSICYNNQPIYNDLLLMVKGSALKKIKFEINRENKSSIILEIAIRLRNNKNRVETNECLLSSDNRYMLNPQRIKCLSAICFKDNESTLSNKKYVIYKNFLSDNYDLKVLEGLTVVKSNNADISKLELDNYYKCKYINIDDNCAFSELIKKITRCKNNLICYVGSTPKDISIKQINNMLFYANNDNSGFVFPYESIEDGNNYSDIWFSSKNALLKLKNVSYKKDQCSTYSFEDYMFYFELIGLKSVSIDSCENVRDVRPYNLLPKKHVLALFHELSLTGAPIVFIPIIKYLIDLGYNIYAISMADGPLKQQLVDLGIPVAILDKQNNKTHWDVLQNKFNFVFANTIVTYKHVYKISKTGLPVIWWIHDAAEGYKGYLEKELPINYPKNVKIYAVSEYAKKVLNHYRPKYNVGLLQYGLDDKSAEIGNNNPFDIYNNKHIFVCSGTIEERKGQDVLAEAIRLLDKKEINDSLFVFIGGVISKKVYNSLLKLQQEYPNNVIIRKPIPHNEVLKYYKYADAVICSSLDDPFPTVMAETMMLSGICICSENTGFASIIENNKNGYVYKNNDPKLLANCISRVIKNKNNISIRKLSRNTFEHYLLLESVKETIQSIIKEIDCFNGIK